MVVEKREQVFVSSTYVDLRDERQEIIQTLLEADCIPSGMELFPASSDERWTLIKRVIDDADYYLVVVGGRYGSVDPETELSYTEMEFDYAVSVDKPVLGFLHGRPGDIPADKIELDPDRRAKLDAFREKVGQRMVKYWNSPQELGAQVAKSLIQIRKTHPVEGWVRASDAIPPEVTAELAELRARVVELTSRQTASDSAARFTAELAGGDDKVEIPAFILYWDSEAVSRGFTYQRNRKTHEISITTTWDDLFAHVGPLMLDEASERQIDAELDALASAEAPNAAIELPDDFGQHSETQVGKYTIQDVVVQFFSLGLIKQSEKRHQVSDKNKYWTLTEDGRNHLMRLRAIRKASRGSSAVSDPSTPDDDSQG